LYSLSKAPNQFFSGAEAIVNTLSAQLDGDFTIDVRRSNLLQDALKEARKRKFDPNKQMKVIFLSSS